MYIFSNQTIIDNYNVIINGTIKRNKKVNKRAKLGLYTRYLLYIC